MQTPRTKSARRGATATIVLLILVLGAVVAGAWFLRANGEGSDSIGTGDTFEARVGSFDITVPTSGELAAREQIEIKNMLDNRSVITEIIDEGTHVKAGDVLVRFNDDDIKNEIKDSQDAVEGAQNDVVNAEATVEINEKTRESEMAKANLRIRLAELALSSWKEGEDVTTRQDLELNVQTTKKEFERSSARFEAAERLLAKEFISLDDYKLDEIALLRARANHDKAKLQLSVYQEYDSVRSSEELQSEVDQSRDEKVRVQKRMDVQVDSAKADLASYKRRLDSRQERLDYWERQKELCVLKAPSDGLVVYASSLESGGYRGRDESPPDVGTEVPRNRTIIVLPDVSQMIAAVKVNEALSGMIQPGQIATVVSDALSDTVLFGEVLNVGVLAESGGWRDPNRRDYTVRILLDDAAEKGLKPSMRCKADIKVSEVVDALHVPVQAVFRDGALTYVYVPSGNGFVQKAVRTGRASELYIEVTEGLEPGDTVLLREPNPNEVLERLERPTREGRGGASSGGKGGKGGGRPGGGGQGDNAGHRGGGNPHG